VPGAVCGLFAACAATISASEPLPWCTPEPVEKDRPIDQQLIEAAPDCWRHHDVTTDGGGDDLSAYEQDWRKRARSTTLMMVRLLTR
jgi:hypothetical protein